jgi:decaprenylphospho-beta-D-erythro-pentofuranosid-2-ulose 2-reductase
MSNEGQLRELPQRVLVLGGTSEIATAIVAELAAGGGAGEVVLAGRDADSLQRTAQRLSDAGRAQVQTLALEARCSEARSGDHGAVLARASGLLGSIDLVILAVGVLGERGGLPADIDGAVEVLDVNVVGAGSLLLHSTRVLRDQGYGTIAVLSSVAAERPRASNAVYCASKAGLDALARGLSDALASGDARVMVVRPGFVTTRMTRGLPVPPLATDPQAVARATVRGLQRGAEIVWVPAALRWVMALVRLLPGPVFRRLGL